MSAPRFKPQSEVSLSAAPERENELATLWEELDLKFQLTLDMHEGDRIIMDADAYRYVRFNNRICGHFGSPHTLHGKGIGQFPRAIAYGNGRSKYPDANDGE
jgi:hypothetical protein